MRPEFELHQLAKRGDDARALLESPLLAEAFAKLRQNYIDRLMETDATQSSVRDKYWMAARVVDVVKDQLTAMVSEGVVAKSDLDGLAQVGERKRRFGLV